MDLRPLFACLVLLLLALPSGEAHAQTPSTGPCVAPEMYASPTTAAARIAAVACSEHRLWYRPFIDADGRLAGSRVREAETARLANGQPAWERVIEYWRDSGLLWQTQAASACGGGEAAIGAPAWCRSFVVDTPWSASFVAWVMHKADVPGYRGSASHVQYVRRAYRDPLGNAYRVAYPQTAKPKQGDLLCYVRVASRVFGFDGVMAQLAGSDGGLNMHCDVVVGGGPAQGGVLYLIGGNVFDGVTMRMLRLDGTGRLSSLPVRAAEDLECSPETPAACDQNRQDWAVLLQLRDEPELLALRQPVMETPPATAPVADQPAPTTQDVPASCCEDCDGEAGATPCAPAAEQAP